MLMGAGDGGMVVGCRRQWSGAGVGVGMLMGAGDSLT